MESYIILARATNCNRHTSFDFILLQEITFSKPTVFGITVLRTKNGILFLELK